MSKYKVSVNQGEFLRYLKIFREKFNDGDELADFCTQVATQVNGRSINDIMALILVAAETWNIYETDVLIKKIEEEYGV